LIRFHTDNAYDDAHARNMDTEELKDTSDELYVLGFIADLCNQESRDRLLLDDMIMYLRGAQELRRRQQSLPINAVASLPDESTRVLALPRAARS
jgi:DNA-binding response OmpR family regulator